MKLNKNNNLLSDNNNNSNNNSYNNLFNPEHITHAMSSEELHQKSLIIEINPTEINTERTFQSASSSHQIKDENQIKPQSNDPSSLDQKSTSITMTSTSSTTNHKINILQSWQVILVFI